MRIKGPTDPDLTWCRDVIERQANQLTRLVEDLLDVSRITQGKIKLRQETVDLGSVVADATEACRPLIDALRHELVVRVPERPLYVRGDPVRLIQIVSNLLNNAAKYQDEGGRIELLVTPEGGTALIAVRDHGPGIDPEVASHVFELFWQGERGKDRAQGGLGVGLSVVRRLVEMHGGSVEINGGLTGQGTEFDVRLPCIAPEHERVHVLANGHATTGTSRRILVVDDNLDSAESMAMLLRLRGHEVMVAHESRKALEIAASTRPSVVLLDIGLPEMDGYEVCRRLRKQGMVDAQIIAMTGYGQERDHQRSLEAGFDSHAVKPVVIEQILELVEAKG
jgi:CheY-like chemotaxis protein